MSSPAAADRDLDPAIYAFGSGPLRILEPAEEAGASFDDRLASVWRYLVQQATLASKWKSARRLLLWNREDLLSEIVLHLRTRDRHWRPERGRYITFVRGILRNFLCSHYRESIRSEAGPDDMPDGDADRPADFRSARPVAMLRRLMADRLDPVDAYILTASLGLNGVRRKTAKVLGLELGLSANSVQARKARALAILRMAGTGETRD